MPVERSRGSRRSGADGSQLVWTQPVEPSSVNGIAFATNLTPGTFNDLPPLMVDPPSEFILFPPPDDLSSPRRPGHCKKKPENHIPRPPNAFILFRSSFIKSQHVSTEVETNHSTLSKIIGLTWQNLSNDERQVWHAKAKAALDEHKRKFPEYAFRPLHGRGKGGPEKRKVREVGPKDMKRCAKIAELLVEGMKGPELDAAIQEFDRHHVPEVVTRFEAPITARMYRRSSSAPVQETTSPHKSFLASTPVTPPRKLRASSTQPTRQVSSSPPPILPVADFPHSPSLQSYSFPPKSEPSFDFTTFTFNDGASPMPPYTCEPSTTYDDTCDRIYSPRPFSHQVEPQCSGRPLSIDTSFIENWTRSSSPISANSMPTTPHYFDSPSPAEDHFSSLVDNRYDLDPSFNQSGHPTLGFSKSFDISQHLPIFPDVTGGFESHPYAASPSNFSPRFGDEHLKSDAIHLDLEFSAFMASLPQYSL